MRKIGDLYTIIENANSDGNIGLINANDLDIAVSIVTEQPVTGPSGVPKNVKSYLLTVTGDYVNGNSNVLPNRIFIGQEILCAFRNKTLPNINAENDVVLKVTNVTTDTISTFISVLSNTDIANSDADELLKCNFAYIISDSLNKNYPNNLYVTNLVRSSNTVSLDFYFTNENTNAVSFNLSYRKKLYTANSEWIYIENITESKYHFDNLDYDETYEIRVLANYENDCSIYSPSLTFKTI
ncbi:MAG: fibronectin type III domain-containing protein [Candidatus Pacearchaeota archaeon]|jgi:hypothetical protein|nr:fibronectin type III domain-containing protein [Clostridia bacterium]